MSDNYDKLYTCQEVAQILRIGYSTVLKHIIEKQLGAVVVGKLYRIPQKELDDYIKRQTIQPVVKVNTIQPAEKHQ